MKNLFNFYIKLMLSLLFLFCIELNATSNILIDEEVKAFPTINKVRLSDNSFHLVSHGKPGELLLEGKWRNAKEIRNWFLSKQLLHGISYLYIYGCEFAKGENGKASVSYLETALGVSIAASDDITGIDGDWDLEVGNSIGSISMLNYPFNLQTCAGIVGGTAASDDFDGDGYCNDIDLDDDNDGILDTNETSCTTSINPSTGFIPGSFADSSKAKITALPLLNYTVPSGSDRILLFEVGFEGSTLSGETQFLNLTGATYGGVPLTLLGSGQVTEGNYTGELTFFYMLESDIPIGTNSFSIMPSTVPSGTEPDISFQAYTLQGVNQNILPVLSTATNIAPGASIQTPSGLSDRFTMGFIFGGNLKTATAGTNTTLIHSTQVEPTESSGMTVAAAYTNSCDGQGPNFSLDAAPNRSVEATIQFASSGYSACDCEIDTDGDGTPDHLDIDSDGDGCPDAIEGAESIKISQLSSGVIAGGVDSDGVPTAVSAGGQGQAIGSSTNSSTVVCCDATASGYPDNDNDGVSDDCDLDDDNDGILDADENSCSSPTVPATSATVLIEDFGSGASPVSSTPLANIGSGYSHSTDFSMSDGQYSLTHVPVAQQI